MIVLKIVIIAISGVVLAVWLKGMKSDMALYLALAVSCIIFYYILGKLSGLIEDLKALAEYTSIDYKYIKILLQMTGITYVSELASSICKDAGHGAIAVQLEIFSKITMIAMGMPVIMALVETIHGM